jgi:hypothetical protein
VVAVSFGLGATSQVQLQVPQADLERARAILADSAEQAQEKARKRSLFWSCPQCGKHADYETEICPSCGALMDPPYDPDAPLEQEETEEVHKGTEEHTDGPRPTEAETWVGDKLATRAFRAAVAGLFLWWPVPPIPVAALYSLYLLFRLFTYSGELSDVARAKLLSALLLDLLVVLVWSLLLLPLTVYLLWWFLGRV